MNFSATKSKVSNRGIPPDSFLTALVNWGRYAPDEIFAVNSEADDVMDSIKPELGPWESPLHRRAAMLEVMRVLAGFEASWDWDCGVDTTNPTSNTPETAEAGIFQISYNSRAYGKDLRTMLMTECIDHGTQFQVITKTDHGFAMEYGARLFRHTTKHNGPLKRKEVNPWLNREAVAEFMKLIS